MKNIDNLKERLTTIENTLPKLNSDIPSEQLVYNQKINEIIEELNNYETQVKLAMNKKIKTILTNDNKSYEEIEETIDKVRKVLIYTSDETDYLSTSGLDEIIYKIASTKDVDIVNEYIKYYLELMNKLGVKLDVTSFDYTYYTSKYMSKVYDSLSSKEYLIEMKKYFDEIYWICPNIIRQLVMCFLTLTEKNKKTINKNIIVLKESLLKELNINDLNINEYYNSLLNEYMINISKNTFNIYDYLRNNVELLKKYNTYKYDKILKTYSDKELKNSEEESIFNDNVRNLSLNLNEYIYLNRFGYLIDYLKDLFDKKNNDIKYSDKELVKLTKKKDSISKLIFKLNNDKTKKGLFKKSEETINRKIRINNAYLISYIDEIYNLTMQGYVTKLNETIVTKLTSSSNIYDALVIMSRNYLALTSIINKVGTITDIDEEIEELLSFIYSRYTNISKNTAIDYYGLIGDLINQKYALSNIKLEVEFDNYSNLKDVTDELDYLNLNYILKNKNLSIEDINICIKREQD